MIGAYKLIFEKNLLSCAKNFIEKLLAKYRKGKERKTKIESFETIKVAMVVANNAKLYVNRKEGFIGSGSSMKKEEFVGECSDIDDIIVFSNILNQVEQHRLLVFARNHQLVIPMAHGIALLIKFAQIDGFMSGPVALPV